MYNLVVANFDNNALTGMLDEFAFQTMNNREDLHSRLRYLDLGNNSFVGALRRLRVLQRTCTACTVHTYKDALHAKSSLLVIPW